MTGGGDDRRKKIGKRSSNDGPGRLRIIMPPPNMFRMDGFHYSAEERLYLDNMSEEERTRTMKEIEGVVNRQNTPLRITVAKSSLKNKTEIMRKLRESGENSKFEQYVRTALSVPVDKYDAPPDVSMTEFIQSALNKLDREIYGQIKLKQETIRALCSWKTNINSSAMVIGLEGPPGVGKTSFAQALGDVMGRPICSIPLGGMNDVSVLSGHSYTYESSCHGMLAQSLIKCGSNSPVIVFDEVDKLPTESSRAQEIVSLLIHLTDPATNKQVHDRYLVNVPMDFSRACFVFTMNDARRVSPILMDRMQLIQMETPTFEDKVNIAKKYIIPREMSRVDMEATFDDDAVSTVVREHSHNEYGVRALQRAVRRLVETLNVVYNGGGQFMDIDVSTSVRNVSKKVLRQVLKAPGQQESVSTSMMYT